MEKQLAGQYVRNKRLWIFTIACHAVAALILFGGIIGALGAELPTIDAVDAIYDIYRVPEPIPVRVELFLNADGHLIARDEKGIAVDFDAMAANSEIMARDYRQMGYMLRKLGNMGRGDNE